MVALFLRSMVLLMVTGLMLSACGSSSEDTVKTAPNTIQTGDARITIFDKAFLIERPTLPHYPRIIGLKGTDYERGYQMGYMLADVIADVLSGFMTPVYAQYGGWVPDGVTPPTRAQWEAGRGLLSTIYYAYFDGVIRAQAPEIYEEMQGLYDGVRASGYEVVWEDVLIGNVVPEITSPVFLQQTGIDAAGMRSMGPILCSQAAAWGEATTDGRLLHGSNYDYRTFGVIPQNLIFAVVKPDKGYGYIGAMPAGKVAQLRSMNEVGLTVSESTSQSVDADIRQNPRLPDHMTLRKIVQNAAGIQEALDLSHQFGPGTTGYNHLIGDGKTPSARVFETSCTDLVVIDPIDGRDTIWAVNHSVAYPGYQGYEGHSKVQDQMAYFGIPWAEVDTIEKWQAAVMNPALNIYTGQRYETLRRFFETHYGAVGVEGMIDVLSTEPLTLPPQGSIQLAPACEQMYGFYRPIKDETLLSIMSAVFDPTAMMIWAAVGDRPAQKGPYWPIDFKHYLTALDSGDFTRLVPDNDKDGLPDDWEKAFGLDPSNPGDAELDADGDGRVNADEYREGHWPTRAD